MFWTAKLKFLWARTPQNPLCVHNCQELNYVRLGVSFYFILVGGVPAILSMKNVLWLKKGRCSYFSVALPLGKDHVEGYLFFFFGFFVINCNMSVIQISLHKKYTCFFSFNCNYTLPILDVNRLSVYILYPKFWSFIIVYFQ